jgi:hypothetical protein
VPLYSSERDEGKVAMKNASNAILSLQSYIREQTATSSSYNLVKQTLVYLDEICGGAQSLGMYIHEDNADLVIQCLRVWRRTA